MLGQPLFGFLEAEYLSDLAPCAEGAGGQVEIIVHPFWDAMWGDGDFSKILFVPQRLVERSPVEKGGKVDLGGEAVGECEREAMAAQGLGGADFFGEIVIH